MQLQFCNESFCYTCWHFYVDRKQNARGLLRRAYGNKLYLFLAFFKDAFSVVQVGDKWQILVNTIRMQTSRVIS